MLTQLPGGRDVDRGGARERSAGAAAAARHPAAGLLRGQGRPGAGRRTAAQLAILLPVAHYGYDVPLPTDASKWLTFAWVAALGCLAGTVLGHRGLGAAGERGVGRDRASPAFAVVLQFFSGVFFAFPELPSWMQQVAALLPLKWLTQGMRSVFLPDEAAAAEVAGQLGARPDRPGAGGMGDHRRRGVRADVPLASGRRVTSGPVRPAAVDPSVRGGRRRPSAVRRAAGGSPSSGCTWSSSCSLGIAVATVVLAPIDGSRALLLAALGVARRWPTCSSARPAIDRPATSGGRRPTWSSWWSSSACWPGSSRRCSSCSSSATRTCGSWSGRCGRGSSGRWLLALASTLGPVIAWTRGERAAVGAGADARSG